MYNWIRQRRSIIVFMAVALYIVVNIITRNTASADVTGDNIPQPSLSAEKIYMTEGSSKILEIHNLQPDAVVSYQVSDTSIAAVSENGVINAVAAGKTEVSVYIQQSSKAYQLSVSIIVSRFTDTQMILEQSEVILGQGEVWKSRIELVPFSSFEQVNYTSEDSSVVQVDNKGEVTAVAIGTTVMKASLPNGNCILYTVTVKDAPSTISIPLVKTIKTGDSYKLEPVIVTGYSNSKLHYQTSDNSIVIVDENGEITALKEGTANITISAYNGINTVVTVRVVDKIGSFSINYISGKSFTLAKSQSRYLKYSVSPSDLSSYAKNYLVWTSDNTEVATVSNDGKVTAVNAGKVNITLSTSDGSVQQITLTVTVTERKKDNSYSQKSMTIVSTSKAKYTYKTMVSDLKDLEKKYGDRIKVSVLADSYDKRHIYQVILGNPNAKKKIMVQAAIHGREYMTSLLTMRQIEFYCRNYYSGRYGGKYYSELFDNVAFYIVPMANPDGVTISQYGPTGIKNKTLRNNVIKLYKKYGKGKYSFYTRWKGNARGVNLNMNFDAYWKTTKVTSKAYGNKGKKAVSELESKVLVNLFNEIKPVKALSYHATGSILYWNYGQTGNKKKTSYNLAKSIKKMTSYSLVKKFDKHHSAGFSDWVSIKKKTCAITLEIGKKACPLSIKEFSKIWSKNRLMYTLFAKSA